MATAAQVWELAEHMPEHLRCVVLLAGFVGLRLGEVLGLERHHVNALHGTLRVEQQEMQLKDGTLVLGPPKTDAGKRALASPTFLAAELEQHLARFVAPDAHARLFPGEQGGPLRRHVLQKHWNRARVAVGLGQAFRFHDLRHTANTLTAATGASTRELMHRMGHASPAAALRYQHATQERDSAIATAVGDLVASRPKQRREARSRSVRGINAG